MAIKNIIAGGIGFSPGSAKWIPTLGFSSSEVLSYNSVCFTSETFATGQFSIESLASGVFSPETFTVAAFSSETITECS